MAAKDTAVKYGIEFSVEPAYILRRLFRWFPFFFENCKTSFHVTAKKVGEPEDAVPVPGAITLVARFANGTDAPFNVALPIDGVPEDQSIKIGTIEVLTPVPGQTMITLPGTTRVSGGVRREDWDTLYSYRVRNEEQLWFGVVGASIIVVQLVVGLCGARIQADSALEAAKMQIEAQREAIQTLPTPIVIPPPSPAPIQNIIVLPTSQPGAAQ